MLTRNCEKEPENRARLTCASDVEPREVEWLWEGRVPLGMITMFAGDPKLGKSLVTLAMAAAVSRAALADERPSPRARQHDPDERRG